MKDTFTTKKICLGQHKPSAFLIAETGTNMQRKLFHLYVNFAIKRIERSVLKEELETCRLNPLYGSFILHDDLGKKGEV